MWINEEKIVENAAKIIENQEEINFGILKH